MSSAPLHAAIQAFEAAQGLRISVHDIGGRLAGFLPPDRFRHQDHRCQLVKTTGHKTACVQSDGPALYPRLVSRGDVVLHICHAGLLECVGPLIVDGRLDAVLYAGVLHPGSQLARTQLTVDDLPSVPILVEPPCAAAQRLLDADPAPPLPSLRHLALTAEHLRQLLARLRQWLHEHASLSSDELASDAWIQRRSRIERFILYRHTSPVRLADLAAELGLSSDRAGHAVRESCGCNWSALLTATRLATAETLLTDTDLPVAEVAERSGFAQAAHFHRMFRKHRGLSPGAFRRQARRAGR